MTQFDPFSLLGLSVQASQQEIETAYTTLKRRLAPNADESRLKPGTAALLAQIKEARSILVDSRQRRELVQKLAKPHNTTFTLRATSSKQVLERLQEPQVLYLLLEILPQVRSSTVSTKRDAGLNLTLVLDHSNSMNGVRLDRVKIAATEIIEQLSEKDTLSVVSFNDRAEVVIPATSVQEKKSMVSRTRMMRASGGTEIFQGLSAGVKENRKHLSPNRVNHIILLTDGNTYGDQDKCLKLARQVSTEGISISTLGLGSEWNDKFLDEIASTTGGSSGFIKSASAVVSFLNNQVQSLSNMFAERIQLIPAAPSNIDIEMAFKLTPSPQPLPHEEGIIQLGGMQYERPISVLLQVQVPANIAVDQQELMHVVVNGSLMLEQRVHTVQKDVVVGISNDPGYEDPPQKIFDALGKLTLYRMQERANEAIEQGNVREATQRLQNLATRLIEVGQEDLAEEAMQEVKRLERTHMLSEEGRKTLKYQTRHLISE
jgi:Ca-activated chloride channel homolog